MGCRRDIELPGSRYRDPVVGTATVPDQHTRRHPLPHHPQQPVSRHLRHCIPQTNPVSHLQHSRHHRDAPGLPGRAVVRAQHVAHSVRALSCGGCEHVADVHETAAPHAHARAARASDKGVEDGSGR